MLYPKEFQLFDALLDDIDKLKRSTDSDELDKSLHEVFHCKEKDSKESLAQKQKNELEDPPSKGKQSFSLFKVLSCAIGIVCGVAFALSCFVFLPLVAQESAFFMEHTFEINASYFKVFNDVYFHNHVKLIRKVAIFLKFQQSFSVTDLDYDECIIENPMYNIMQPAEDCEFCVNIDKPLYAPIDESSRTEEDEIDHPVIFKHSGTTMDLNQLHKIFTTRPTMMNSDTVLVTSNRPDIRSMEDLKKDDVPDRISQDPGIHVIWTARAYLSSHIIRPSFPYPVNVSQLGNIVVARTYKSKVHIDGHNGPSYLLKPAVKGQQFVVMYIQAMGTRNLTISPLKSCADQCASFSVLMEPKDVMFYVKDTWTVLSESHGESLSISYLDELETFNIS